MESFESEYKANETEPSSSTVRHHVTQSTVHLLQARLVLARMIREQETCSPGDLLQGRIKALTLIVAELLTLQTLLRVDSKSARSPGDPEHLGSIVDRCLVQTVDRCLDQTMDRCLVQMAAERSAQGASQ
jgi:hypothetical protein